MNKTDLAKVLSAKIKKDPKIAEKLINSLGDIITEVLSKGGKIVYSNFGTFYTVHYPSKVIFHPTLGAKKKMIMLPTNAVKWMPSGNIKDMVNSGKEIESATTFGASKKLMSIEASPKTDELAITKTDVIEPKINKISEDNDDLIVSKNTEEATEEEIEIPIRRVSKEQVGVPATVEDKKVVEETADKNGFWDQLFKKASDDSKPSIDSKPTESEDNKEAKDDKSSPSVGLGLFGSATSSTPITKVESQDISKEEKSDNKISALGKEKVEEVSKEDPAKQEEDLSPFINRNTSISYIDLSKTTVPKEILQMISEKIAREYKIVPIEDNENGLVVGMVDPEDIEAIEIVKKIVGKKISPKLTTETDLNHILDQYQGFESEVKEAIDDAEDKDQEEDEENGDKKSAASVISNSAPASRIVSSLLKRAIRDKASDIHIEPYEGEVTVRFRIDGVLHKKVSLPKEIQQAIVSRIKILSNLKIDEQRLPQDGRFSITTDSRKVDFRVSTMPIANGEKVVMRILDKLSGIISIDDLGFRERDFNLINNSCQKSHGMILVTGPTGSGKTTTLYALIQKIYSEGINIITLEDPIEYQIPGINQSQVNSEIDYTFASGLRSILRQDPDVVMIGEIRDKETAEMAVHAALTGHVVLSTLHTNDSAGAIPRLIDMNIEPFLLNSSMNLILAQRLARRICDSCKEEISPSHDQIKLVKDELDKMPKEEKTKIGNKIKFYKGKGCKECSDTGYKGRIGIYEVLEVDKKIKDLVAHEASSNEIEESAVQNGMTTMVQDGILKAINGLTTIEEVWRVTKE